MHCNTQYYRSHIAWVTLNLNLHSCSKTRAAEAQKKREHSLHLHFLESDNCMKWMLTNAPSINPAMQEAVIRDAQQMDASSLLRPIINMQGVMKSLNILSIQSKQ